jgi:hypothetical protein
MYVWGKRYVQWLFQSPAAAVNVECNVLKSIKAARSLKERLESQTNVN